MRGGRIFSRILPALSGRGSFCATGEGIARWWTERGRPLTVDGSTAAMDDSPPGLVLTFKTKGERALTAEGGVIANVGGQLKVTAAGGPLRVSVR